MDNNNFIFYVVVFKPLSFKLPNFALKTSFSVYSSY